MSDERMADELNPYLYETRHMLTVDELRAERPDVFRQPDTRERAGMDSLGWLFQGVLREGIMFSPLDSFDGKKIEGGPVAMFVVVDDLGARRPPSFAALWTPELGWTLPRTALRR